MVNRHFSIALRVFGLASAVLIALPVMCYCILFLINLKDDPLSPRVETLLSAKPVSTVEAAHNGYFAWIGVVGPEDQDPNAWGQRWFDAVLAVDKVSKTSLSTSGLAINKEKRKEDQGSLPCKPPNDDLARCLFGWVDANPDAAHSILQKGSVTLERADKAVSYTEYQEPWRPDYSLSSYSSPSPNGWIILSGIRFALAAKEGRHDEAMDQMAREIAFHTRQLQGDVAFADKTGATHNLSTRYRLINQYLLRHPEPAKAHADRISEMLAPLPKEVTSLEPSIALEERVIIAALLIMKENKDYKNALLDDLGGVAGSAWSRAFLLFNTTANECASAMDRWIHANGVSGSAYHDAIVDAQTNAVEQVTGFKLRNLTGHWLLATAYPSLFSFFVRRDNLLALRALVAFRVRLFERGIVDPSAIEQAIRADRDTLMHPYDENTPIFDKEKHELKFLNSTTFGDQELAIQTL